MRTRRQTAAARSLAVLACLLALAIPACNSSDLIPPVGGPIGGSTQLAGTATNSVTTNPLDLFVTLTFTPTGGGTPVQTTCDTSGQYSIGLSAGDYDITASRPGYQDYAAGAVAVVDGQVTTHDFAMDPLPANSYIASATCARCHPTIYDTFRRTGHPFKLNKIVNNQEPTYPFSSITGALAMVTDEDGVTDNSLGTPTSYADVSYVIGGFGWKARFMDANGYIVTGSEVQYNLETMSMVAYHDNEIDKPYDCGNCHTTGWKHFDAANNNARQDNLPGIDGTWAEAGIQCEACHGAGATHAQTLDKADITRIATARTTADFLAADMAFGKPVACSECHTRDGEKDYPTFVSAYNAANGPETEGGRTAAAGGLVRHHEQYDELLGVDPDNVTSGSTRSAAFMAVHLNCRTCHSPHNTTRYQDDPTNPDPDGVNKANADCMVCHPNNDPNNANTTGMKGLNCIDCHMPKMVKSAVTTGPVGSGPLLGDIKSHIFRIDLTKDPATEQFTAAGDFAYPWITRAWACFRCHNGVDRFDISFLDFNTYKFHN